MYNNNIVNNFNTDSCGCDCLDRKTPAMDEVIKNSTVLQKSSSSNKCSSRRRGSLPSPPLQPFSIKESIHRAKRDSVSLEEEEVIPPVLPEDANQDDFIDEVEEEILVLFGDKDEDGCDDNQDDMDEDENSWSPSPLIIDSTVVNEMDDPNSSSIKSSKPQPPVIEEENGKIKVTEQFMRDLIR